MNHYDKIETDGRKIKALDELDAYLSDLQASSDPKQQKKASLLCFWIKDFVQYLDFEDGFDSTRLIKYKRGDVIKLDFGFNIGSELGGLHYAIVLDNSNSINSSILTVAPLSSKRDLGKISFYNVDLGDEIYTSLKLKFDSLKKSADSELEDLMKIIDSLEILTNTISDLSDAPEFNLPDTKAAAIAQSQELKDDLKSKANIINGKISILDKTKSEIERMKKGSVAQISQITTVSKIRIFDPKTNKSVLHSIKISSDSLDLIDAKITELYLKKVKKE